MALYRRLSLAPERDARRSFRRLSHLSRLLRAPRNRAEPTGIERTRVILEELPRRLEELFLG
eukprot:8105131-Pyramimonas_sp.AAC.1